MEAVRLRKNAGRGAVLRLRRRHSRSRSCMLLLPVPQGRARQGWAAPTIVDDAEIGKVGSCEVESWNSSAGNGDRISVFSPACVVNFGAPVELGTNLVNARSDGEGISTISLTAKTVPIPIGPSGFGLALSGAVVYDPFQHAANGAIFTVPVTFDLSEKLRLNINVGAQYNGDPGACSSPPAGAGVSWNFVEQWSVISEVFALDRSRCDQPPLSERYPLQPDEGRGLGRHLWPQSDRRTVPTGSRLALTFRIGENQFSDRRRLPAQSCTSRAGSCLARRGTRSRYSVMVVICPECRPAVVQWSAVIRPPLWREPPARARPSSSRPGSPRRRTRPRQRSPNSDQPQRSVKTHIKMPWTAINSAAIRLVSVSISMCSSAPVRARRGAPARMGVRPVNSARRVKFHSRNGPGIRRRTVRAIQSVSSTPSLRPRPRCRPWRLRAVRAAVRDRSWSRGQSDARRRNELSTEQDHHSSKRRVLGPRRSPTRRPITVSLTFFVLPDLAYCETQVVDSQAAATVAVIKLK